MSQRRRGGALLLVLVVLATIGIVAGVVASRRSVDLHARRADELRVQVLWLARSAADAGVSGLSDLETPWGRATVSVLRDTVRVELAGARATVQRTPWTERYEPPAAARR